MTRKEAIIKMFNETPADYINEEFETPDFFEFHVNCGGDACVYRVYKRDGMVCER